MRVRAFMLAAVACLPAQTVLQNDFDPWADLEWPQHPEAIEAVASHPEGMTLEQIGRLMGITRERVRQIEASALRKLKTGDGTSVLLLGRHAMRVPDCEGCAQPFIPTHGRDRRCALCRSARRRRHRH